MSDTRITITGADEIERKCNPELYAASITRILTKTAIQGENLAKERSPVDTGRLRSSIAHEIDSSSPPMWARFGTNVRYGLYLNSPVTRDPHYRAGPRRGASTAEWMTGVAADLSGFAAAQVAGELSDIEGKWSS